MILPTGRTEFRAGRSHPAGGFTLIELILTLVLLATMAAFVAPTLSNFFRGQNISSEAKRFVSLTRFARAEAISKSVPMTVWINTEEQAYGLRPAAGFEYEDNDSPEIYRVNENVQLYIEDPVINRNDEITISFMPDGSLDENSQDSVELRNVRDQNDRILIAVSRNRLGYRIWNEDDYIAYRNSL